MTEPNQNSGYLLRTQLTDEELALRELILEAQSELVRCAEYADRAARANRSKIAIYAQLSRSLRTRAAHVYRCQSAELLRGYERDLEVIAELLAPESQEVAGNILIASGKVAGIVAFLDSIASRKEPASRG